MKIKTSYILTIHTSVYCITWRISPNRMYTKHVHVHYSYVVIEYLQCFLLRKNTSMALYSISTHIFSAKSIRKMFWMIHTRL